MSDFDNFIRAFVSENALNLDEKQTSWLTSCVMSMFEYEVMNGASPIALASFLNNFLSVLLSPETFAAYQNKLTEIRDHTLDEMIRKRAAEKGVSVPNSDRAAVKPTYSEDSAVTLNSRLEQQLKAILDEKPGLGEEIN